MTIAHRVTFGVKTSQANTTDEDVLRTWRQADGIPVFEHAVRWLADEVIEPVMQELGLAQASPVEAR